jgi:hypothetical protein
MANPVIMTATQLAKYLKCRRTEVIMMTEATMIPSINISTGCRPKYRYVVEEVIEKLRTQPPEKSRRKYAGIEATFIV